MHLDPFELFVSYAVLVFAISVHEAAHAWTASRYGDPTARMLGRITLNPIYHIDPIGTFAVPVIAMISGMPLIGWGKPTPVNPLNFGRNHVRADIMTSVAGPISNLLVATASVLVLAIVARAQSMLGGAAEPLLRLFVAALEINVLLAVFNIIPLPPLDGSHVLRHALSGRSLELYDRIGVFGLLLLFVVGRSIIRTLEAPFMAFFARLLVAIS
jgi:Zn-dependent protease